MNEKSSCHTRGFTLIELVIVLVIIGIMTPVLFRFYHEGVKKRFTHLTESSDTLQGTRVLFKYLEHDLRNADSLVSSFGKLKTDKNTLIIKAVSPKERVRLLKRTGDLWKEFPDKDNDCIIVYRSNQLREIVREIYQGKIVSISSVKNLPGEAKATSIVYSKKDTNGLVLVSHAFSQTALLRDVEAAEFTYNHQRLEEASWVRVVVSRRPGGREVRPVGTLYRIFGVG